MYVLRYHFFARYLSPSTKQPDDRDSKPMDFKELRPVNPMDFPFWNERNALRTRFVDVYGLIAARLLEML